LNKAHQIRDIPPGFSLFRQDLDHIADALRSEWQALSGARLFITGGTGFFGIWLLEALLWVREQRAVDLELVVLTRSADRFVRERAPHLKARAGLEFVQGDLINFEQPSRRCTHILHAASETNLERSADWPARHITTALDGTRRLLDMAVAHQVQAMLVTTSGAVYAQRDTISNGRCVEGPASVQDYISEASVYGQSKRMMEIMTAVAAHTHGFRAPIARCFCFVGPYLSLDSNYAVGNFLSDALAGREIVVSGDGMPLRSYLYAADLVSWLITILTRGRSGVPYNVGGELPVSIGDLARTIARLAGSSDSVLVRGIPSGSPPSVYLPDLLRARTDLALNVTVNLEDALARTLDWYRLRTPYKSLDTGRK
jgi:dTDP-glucose 4,6-dehydratase